MLTTENGSPVVKCHVKVHDGGYISERVWVSMDLDMYLQIVQSTRSLEELEREMYLAHLGEQKVWAAGLFLALSDSTGGEGCPQMAKISVLIPDEEAARFCAYCEEKGYKKSTLIARLVREHLNQEGYASQARLFEKPPNSAKSTKDNPRGG